MKTNSTLLKKYSTLKMYLSCYYIFLEWSMIFISIFLYLNYFHSFLLLPLFIIFIGTRMYALYSLLHDGLHYLLYSNKKTNDFFTKVFLAWPLFISLSKMRATHFKHHKYLLTDKDPEFQLSKYPEFQFPLSKFRFLKIILFDLLGLNFIKYKMIGIYAFFKSGFDYSSWIQFALKAILAIVVIYGLNKLQLLQVVLLFWIIPYATVYQLLNRLRAYTEHFNLPLNVNTRSLTLNPLISFFITPHGLGYHEAHHKYPYIPHFNLKEVHYLILLENADEMLNETSVKDLLNSILK